MNEGDPYSLLVRSDPQSEPTFRQPSISTHLTCPSAEIETPFPMAFVCSTYTPNLASVIRTPDIDRHVFPSPGQQRQTTKPQLYHTASPLLTPVRPGLQGNGYLNDSNPRHIELRPSFVAEFRAAAATIGKNIQWPNPIPLVVSYLLRSMQHVYDSSPGDAASKFTLLQQLVHCLPVVTRDSLARPLNTSHRQPKVVWDIFSGTGSTDEVAVVTHFIFQTTK